MNTTPCLGLSARLGAAVVCASILAACEVDRPAGSYQPTAREWRQGNPDLFPDGGGGGGGGSGEPPPPEPDAGMVTSGPLSKLQGYYWLRTDIEFTVSESKLGTTVEVFNRASHMALTRLTAHPDNLQAVELTCHVFYQHVCRRNCATFVTKVAPDAAQFYRAIHPKRVYTLTNGNRQFVTDAVALALGFTGDPNSLPSSISEPTVWDVDRNGAKDGLYLNVAVTGLPNFGGTSDLNCYFNTVERFRSGYNGTLQNGSLDGVTATLNTEGSDAKRLHVEGDSTCTSKVANPSPSSSKVRFKKVEVAGNPDAFWSCPSLSDFKARLPDPT